MTKAKKTKSLKMAAPLRARFAKVKLLLCDVDGVLTDASVFMGNGMEIKRFHIQDGLGLRLLMQNGVRVGWVSARPSQATEQRAADLKIDFLHQASGSKIEAAREILKKAKADWEEVCYMGDDVVDLGLLGKVGLAVALVNGIDETKEIAHYVTKRAGGYGAVREVVDLILKAQGKWEEMVRKHSEA